MTEVDDSIKFAWAYLLLHGRVTTGEWSYYGGYWEEPVGMSWEDVQSQMERLREVVPTIGIDWEQTGIPTVSHESEFMDTESPSRSCLATLGKLVLKSGETFLIGSQREDAAHLAETARKIMQGKTSAITLLADKL